MALEYLPSAVQALVDQTVDRTELGCRRRLARQVGDHSLFAKNICRTEVFGHLPRMYLQPGQQLAALGTMVRRAKVRVPFGVP